MEIRQLWKCSECDHITESAGLLEAPNPFQEGDTLTGCPTCKGVNTFEAACDEPGCTKSATCGWPTADGYRRTCYEHWDKQVGPKLEDESAGTVEFGGRMG